MPLSAHPPAQYLVGDVGGTNTRLALARLAPQGWVLEQLQVMPTSRELPQRLREYRRTCGVAELAAAAFCGAGPPDAKGSLRLTNADCTLCPEELAEAAGVERALVLNDFAAVAHSIAALKGSEVQALDQGRPIAKAPRLVLGPGTGLGVAALVPEGAHWRVLSGEGGHVSLAAVSEIERGILAYWRDELGRVTAEHLLSGPGLERIDAALRAAPRRSAAAISAAAAAGEPTALAGIEIFSRWLGRYAGGLALTLNASGGVYLAGGIVPGWGAGFSGKIFREGFEDHAPHSARLSAMPSYVVRHPQPGLLGLAVCAERAIGRRGSASV